MRIHRAGFTGGGPCSKGLIELKFLWVLGRNNLAECLQQETWQWLVKVQVTQKMDVVMIFMFVHVFHDRSCHGSHLLGRCVNLRNAVRSIACLYLCIPTLAVAGSGSSCRILQMDGKAREHDLCAALFAMILYTYTVFTYIVYISLERSACASCCQMLARVFSCKGKHIS